MYGGSVEEEKIVIEYNENKVFRKKRRERKRKKSLKVEEKGEKTGRGKVDDGVENMLKKVNARLLKRKLAHFNNKC